jgi:hypothetical protein
MSRRFISYPRRGRGLSLALVLAVAVAGGAAGQVAPDSDELLAQLAFRDPRLGPQADTEPLGDLRSALAAPVVDGWDRFLLDAGSQWIGSVDKRTGRLELAEGAGIPWVPGRGNTLTAADLAARLGRRGPVDRDTLEAIARGFLPRVAPMLGVDPKELVINPGRSAHPADYLWFVDFDVVRGGLPIEGARVVFRVNHGNLIQLGTEGLPAPGATVPKAAVSRQQALAAVSDFIGGVTPWDTFSDPGSLRLVTVAVDDPRFADGYELGRGRGLALVWELVFQREGALGSWRARVDAVTGELRELIDLNRYGVVTGGVYLTAPAAGETVKPMPFADVTGSTYANSSGYFSSGSASTLNGQYVRILDTCGSISRSLSGSDIPFGTSAGTDCTTPGSGGAGNTHAARTSFYHLNRARENGRGWLPSTSWLTGKLTANTDINLSCNAFWSTTAGTVNFYRSGGGCANTGELAGVVYHEYGHGLDQNDGSGSSVDWGSGEAYGDFVAALALRTSCIGSGYKTSNCAGYGDACTGCSGIRDIDYAKHASGVAHTVSNFTQIRCSTNTYAGPCGREAHCESYVASEALWDLAARDLPSPNTNASWAIADRLWYLSRATATKSFNCTTGGTFTSNGCFTGSWWRTMRAVADDDGNLANGVPNGGSLYAAFNRHGIACTTDAAASTSFRAVTPPAVPTLTLTAGNNQATVSWTSSGSGVVYDVYRSDVNCNSGFAKVGNDKTGTSWTDTALANGQTFYYFVTAQPTGNEAAASNPSTCKSVIPVYVPPPPPLFAVTASGPGFITVKAGYNLTGSANYPATNWKWERSDDGGPYYLWANSQNTSFVAFAGHYEITWKLTAQRVSDGVTDTDLLFTTVCIPNDGSCILALQGDQPPPTGR